MEAASVRAWALVLQCMEVSDLCHSLTDCKVGLEWSEEGTSGVNAVLCTSYKASINVLLS